MSSVARLAMATLLLMATDAHAQSRDDVTCLLRPRHTVQLGSPINGVLAGVDVDRGDRVHAGQVLARIEASVEAATVALDQARASDTSEVEEAHTQAGMLGRKLDRTKALADKHITSAVTLDEVQSDFAAAEIKERAADTHRQIVALEAQRSAAAFELKRIKSPIDGVVVERKLEPGDYVSEQTPILTIAELDPLDADVIVPGHLYGSLRLGSIAEVRPAAPVGGVYEGKIDVIDPVIDAASDTFGVRIVFPNPDEKIPAGLRCDVRWRK